MCGSCLTHKTMKTSCNIDNLLLDDGMNKEVVKVLKEMIVQ